jgi:folate-binding protein YgfZ
MTWILDQSEWGQLRLQGPDRVRFLQGMCIGDVAALAPGEWLKTAMLSHKGRVLSIFDAVALEQELILICRPEIADRTEELLDKHLIADDVEIVAERSPVHRVLQTAADLWTAPPVWAAPPAPVSPEDELEVLRIEAGLPRYGVDVDEQNFPFETPLGQLIDYRKGCYVGQEPVARVHARGAPSKEMRGLRFVGTEPLAHGPLLDRAGKEAGRVTSHCVSPRLGCIALAYVNRAHIDACELVVGERHCAVVDLPFAAR